MSSCLCCTNSVSYSPARKPQQRSLHWRCALGSLLGVSQWFDFFCAGSGYQIPSSAHPNYGHPRWLEMCRFKKLLKKSYLMGKNVEEETQFAWSILHHLRSWFSSWNLWNCFGDSGRATNSKIKRFDFNKIDWKFASPRPQRVKENAKKRSQINESTAERKDENFELITQSINRHVRSCGSHIFAINQNGRFLLCDDVGTTDGSGLYSIWFCCVRSVVAVAW